jgi:hypothetical protein
MIKEDSKCALNLNSASESMEKLRFCAIVLGPLAIDAQKLEDKSVGLKFIVQRYRGIMALQCYKSSLAERSWSSLRQ